jgi:hypothetical protein
MSLSYAVVTPGVLTTHGANMRARDMRASLTSLFTAHLPLGLLDSQPPRIRLNDLRIGRPCCARH